MRLWTIQDERVMDDLESKGVYAVDPVNTMPYMWGDEDEPNFHEMICYRWMAHQLALKSPRPDGVKFPIWAWKRYDKDHDKPDMRSWTTDEPEKVVRLTLDVPDDDIIVSDFELWHMPLNCGFCSYSREEDEQFDAWCESVGIDRFQRDIWDFSKHSHDLHEARRRVFRSWERIIDPDPDLFDEDWAGKVSENSLQAVFWVIKSEYVKKVEHFTTRRAARM